MKKSLADRIEEYIKVLISRSENNQIEIQRIELAETFCCVPSQVTYVISTRFTEQNGYYTESRRGGSGYVRIAECNRSPDAGLSQRLYYFIQELDNLNLLTAREAEIIRFLATRLNRDLPDDCRDKANSSFIDSLRELFKRVS